MFGALVWGRARTIKRGGRDVGGDDLLSLPKFILLQFFAVSRFPICHALHLHRDLLR